MIVLVCGAVLSTDFVGFVDQRENEKIGTAMARFAETLITESSQPPR